MTKNIFLLFVISFITFNANAAKPELLPQDVYVINTPTVTVGNDAANPIPVTVQGGITVTSEPQFVGFSNDSVQGDVGLVGMHGACAATYGTDARICLEIEVFNTPNLQPVPPVPSGWVQSNASQTLNNNNCTGWTSAVGRTGYVLSGERMQLGGSSTYTYPGGILTTTPANCDELRPVACCK